MCIGTPSACSEICGDGLVVGIEDCDDSGVIDGDGCSGVCGIEAGYECVGEPSTCAPACGDGLIILPEGCDDGGLVAGDGCNGSCQVEPGFDCSGVPTVCTAICGDGLVVAGEGCDDGGTALGDGCGATCQAEPGYVCTGSPSVCQTVCGDGVPAGAEECDDGNLDDTDGCSSSCVLATGESCGDPLVMWQATPVGGALVWTIPGGSVTQSDASLACDPNTHGPDAVIEYVKASDTVANGGDLLHIVADTTATTSTSYYLNVEVVSGDCTVNPGTSEKCLWYKDNWDVYLDVPPGVYYLWVGKNSPATASQLFPEVTVTIEEIPASDAEGEGCFAPYDASSTNYTPPAGAGQPHIWTLPASVNSFDMGATWGEPGSISCDNTAPYGDIHGVDAVIEYTKASPTSVLKVDVQNLDPTLSASDLDVEVLNVCDPSAPAKISRNCRANKDTVSFTAPSPAGPVYLWVSTEATGEEFNGASVQVTEIFPGVGESWPTAQPLLASGPISPTSTQRLDAPDCFPATGNVHWYSYTLTNDALSLSANAAGHVGVYDEGGQQLQCVTNASTAPIGLVGVTGETFYIAVQSPSTIGSFTLADIVYSGVDSEPFDMGITFPASALGEYGMAVSGTELFMGDGTSVFAFPKTVGAAAIEHGTADGLTSTHLGYDLLFAGGSLFSADSATTTNASRLFRIYDGTTWGPTAWDLTPTYPASSPTHAIATDGSTLFSSTRRTSTNANFYSLSPALASTPTLLGTNSSVWYVVGMAADAQYFYVASNGAQGEGVYRLLRSNIPAAAEKIATLDTDTLCNNVELDSFTSPQNLYVRDGDGSIHAVVAPASATPTHVGAITTLGTTSDYAMTFDKLDGALYFFETETDANGVIRRMD